MKLPSTASSEKIKSSSTQAAAYSTPWNHSHSINHTNYKSLLKKTLILHCSRKLQILITEILHYKWIDSEWDKLMQIG